MAQTVAPPPSSGRIKDVDSKTLTNWYQAMRSPAGGVAAPASSTSTGIAGQIAYDANFLYICIGTNLWRRVPLGAF